MREKGKSLLLISLATLFLVSTVMVSVRSASTPNVYVEPQIITDPTKTPGQNFTITIRIADVTDMWSYRVDLRWAPSVLDVPDNTETPEIVEGVTEGPFLQSGGSTNFVGQLDQPEGTLSVRCDLQAGGEHQSGGGILFSVKFTVELVGATVLDIYFSRVQVKGPPPMYLPTPIDHTSQDGFFTNVSGGNYDIAVTNVTTSKTIVCQGYSTEINVTVQNQGNVLQGFTVNAYYNSNYIGTEMAVLSTGTSTTKKFTLDATSVEKGIYTISANASVAPGEVDTADNIYVDGTVRVSMAGDVAPAWDLVDIVDVVYVAISFGSKKGESKYNPNADIDGNGVIDIVDIVIVAIHFGQTDP